MLFINNKLLSAYHLQKSCMNSIEGLSLAEEEFFALKNVQMTISLS